ncbi:uncharacterized protein LOC121770276 [Salvia splendens]|uniref:uncharacterized protein LOC121770276 n=1 Tax=Salvia splendens TaxID=180675 RepID=UPI001C277581|nr:uncharacterized protein LOC121770276 [Salvia splendens]
MGGSSSSDENDVADFTYIQFGEFRGLIRLPKTSSTPTLNEDEDEDDEIINEKERLNEDEDDGKVKESVVSTPYKPTANYSSTESDRDSEAPHNGDALPDQPNAEPENSTEADNGFIFLLISLQMCVLNPEVLSESKQN